MKLFGLLLILLSSKSIALKDVEYIRFSHQNKTKHIQFKLPLKCRLYTSENDKRYGRIEKVVQGGVLFSFHNYDTVKVNEILALDIKRKDREILLDTLISQSKESEEITFNDIHKITILSADGNAGRKILMLISSLGFMGSGIGLLVSTSSNVGKGVKPIDWVMIGGMGASAGIMATLIKRNLHFDKWKIEVVG